ncbi:DUF2293 domain-containing protein [Ciceribacter azotifigens]|uniref:DUF2293 domain-containing protein n=1 Tax=Ciceribacter azotifigens TaxID=2069303 RepID=UPI003A83FB2A
MSRFTREAVIQHIAERHPKCPDFAVSFFAEEVARRTWNDAPLGMAVGITMQNTLRHLMTDYDQLLLCGIDREEARRRVQPRINAMIAQWSGPKRKRRSKRRTGSESSASE